HFAGDNYARFQGKVLNGVKNFWRDLALGNHALNHAGAIAEYREQQFAAFPQIVEPALYGDSFTLMLADLCNGADRRLCGGFHSFDYPVERFIRPAEAGLKF